MTPESQDLKIENVILRGALAITAMSSKDYHDAKHVKTEDGFVFELTVDESLRPRAKDALERAEKLLKEPEKGKGR